MANRVSVRESPAKADASIWCQILGWNGIRADVVEHATTGVFRVEIDESDEGAARAVLDLLDNASPANPDRFAFISHTARDQPFIDEHITPIVKSKRIDFILLNYKRFSEEYARFVLRALANCGWFLVVLSRNTKDSPWVKFELDWALRHRDPSHIVVIRIDDVRPQEIDVRLDGVGALDFGSSSPESRQRLSDRLPEIRLSDRLD